MVKEKFDEFFVEYAHSYLWDINRWKAFENRFILTGFIHFNDTQKIAKTKEGYKAFFDSIFFDLDKINQLESLSIEQLLYNSRRNIHILEGIKSKKRQTFDFLFAVIIGVLTKMFWNWEWLLIIIGFYSFLKANIHYNNLRRISPEFLISTEKLKEIKNVSDPVVRENQLKGFKDGYTISQWFFQFILTFLIVGTISSLIKLTLSYAVLSPIWLSIYIVVGSLFIYSTLKRVWGTSVPY